MTIQRTFRSASTVGFHTPSLLTQQPAHKGRQAVPSNRLLSTTHLLRNTGTSPPCEVINIQNDQQFKDLISSDNPVCVDFHAE